MIFLGFLHIFLFGATFVFATETSPHYVAACGKSFTLLTKKLSRDLRAESTTLYVNHVVNTSSIEDCVESCCKQENCNYAVQIDGLCFNVQCPSYQECQTEDDQIKDDPSHQTVQVREIEEGCSKLSKSCEVGVDNCYENEECMAMGRRRKSGCCKCMTGFARHANGTCINVSSVQVTGVAGVTSTTETTTTTATTPPTTSTTRYIRHLAISITPTSIQLPEVLSNITAIVVPDPEPNEEYSYKWSVVSYPQDQQLGTVEGNNEKTLKLSHLSPGEYAFLITVSSPSSFGETLANLTVLPPLRVNQRPVAVIQPSSQTIQLPNKVAILNGLSSTDDNKIVSYKWELEKAPISYQFEFQESDTLELKDLVAGNYTVKLTVTDSDGETNFTQATVEVLKEIDYPPEANAGASIILILPDNEVTLNGSLSTDDHGITTWEWTLVNNEEGGNEPAKAIDMQNTNTPYPRISRLMEGMYRFQLKVYDAAGQSSASKVDVLVRRPSSSEPRVEAGNNVTITLPVNWVALDGSKSVDDDGVIQKWLWTQLLGPAESVILDADQPKVNVTSLVNGSYTFQLTAWDKSGASASDNVTVTVLPKENEKPKANAGGDQSLSLPLKWVILNGSSSTDDQGIRSWLWTREPDSLAAGVIIANSDRTSTLMLTNLVPGKYVFRLTVTDAQGLSDYDIVSLVVHKNPRELDVVTISLKSDPRTFTENELATIREQLALLLHQQGSTEINVNIDDVVIEPKSGYSRTVLQFYTSAKSDGMWRTLPGAEVAALLRKKLRSDLNLLTYPVLDVDTAICQNNCSGHGVCDQYTRRCICQSFWMENPFKVSNSGDYNCDWSLVYVVIIVGLIVFTVVALGCYLVQSCINRSFSCKKYFPKKRRRTHRYAPLSDPAAIKLTPKGSPGSTLLPSDFDSEEESDVVFESKKNGHANGRALKSDDTYA